MPIQATIDTNLLISGTVFRNGPPGRLLDAIAQQRFTLVTSNAQRAELDNVLRRPKFSVGYRVTDERRDALLRLLDNVATFVDPVPVSHDVVRDEKDRHIIGAAVAGSVNYLVSGDKDLLVLAGHPILGSVQAITAVEFLTKLEL